MYGGRPRPRRLFDRDLAPPRKKAQSPPNFWLCLLWPNGWMDVDATWYRSRPRPRPQCVRRGPSSPVKGHSSPHSPLFSPCLLWLRSPIAGTAELLFKLTVAKTMVLLLTIGGYKAHLYAYFFRPGSVLKPKPKSRFGGRKTEPKQTSVLTGVQVGFEAALG